MDDTSPSSSTTADQKEISVKQAACLNCRRSKVRCLRNAEDTTCRRCHQTNACCIIPDYHVGRKKGIKNKRGGLDKAVFRIEQAIKKARAESGQPGGNQEVFRLQSLLSEAQGVLAGQPALPSLSLQDPRSHEHGQSSYRAGQIPQSAPAVGNPPSDDNYAVDDAENPLQLLARASDISTPPFPVSQTSTYIPSMTAQLPSQDPHWKDDLQAFFGPFRPSLDIGEDIDPIALGLVSFEEADVLFNYFYQNLAHTRWGLDELLHTPTFVRNQSAFLFTSILATSALFMSSTAALSRRLSNHCKHMAHTITVNRRRSPELVLAFMINIPWMSPGKHWSDDETCFYMAAALTIAVDISLNKVIIPSPSNSRVEAPQLPQSECITARKALDLDGFHDVDPASPLGRRLLRRRERVWLALFVLDRGVCMARGRSYTVPLTPLIECCDEWHKSDLSDVWDGSIISSAVLRRDLVNLVTNINDICQRDRQITASILQEMIEGFFNRWYARWAFATGAHGNSIPPYVEILVAHGRLSVYSSVINHPTAPPEVKRFFRSAGLSSALSVMRAAVQGEGRLKSMPNNTVIMISFAAMICFRLSTLGTNSNHSLAPSIRILIEETADVLERIGTNPSHRKGISAMYGRHLREVTGTGGRRQYAALDPNPVALSRNDMRPPTYAEQPPTRTLDVHPVQFSAMSDDQITQAIRNAEDDLGTDLPSFQLDERSGLDWLDWFDLDITV